MPVRLTENQRHICQLMGVSTEDYARQVESDRAEEVAALKAQQGLTPAQLEVCRVMGVDPKDHPAASSASSAGVAACTLDKELTQDQEVLALVRRYKVIR